MTAYPIEQKHVNKFSVPTRLSKPFECIPYPWDKGIHTYITNMEGKNVLRSCVLELARTKFQLFSFFSTPNY